VEKGEDQLIAWIRGRRPADDPRFLIDLGDDMAHLAAPPGGLLVSADMLMDGVDFDAGRHPLEAIGRKALAAGLSDCAAMAVQPVAAMLCVALPREWSMEQAQRLVAGLGELADAHDCPLIGGDTNSWDHPLAIDVIVLAQPWPGIFPVRRDGMKPGDSIYVTGALGGSLHEPAGALPHHLTFQPRVGEARLLASSLRADLHALMDLSDGLSIDARRMAQASGCGVELDETALIFVASSQAAAASKQDGRPILSHVLDDGEDFELLAAIDGRRASLSAVAGCDLRCTRIGTATAEPGLWLRRTDGRRVAIEPRGYQHFRGD
jgi:thiamine-monophosphate kinase